jgi:hypothetical protein
MFPPVKQISYGIREDQSSMQQGLLQFKAVFPQVAFSLAYLYVDNAPVRVCCWL